MTTRSKPTATFVVAIACTLAATGPAASQSIPIGIIDVYGLNRVSADRVRAALMLKEGDTVSLAGEGRPSFATASEARLAALPGVSRARISLVCCENGLAIVYVGIEEHGAPTMSFRASPGENVRLAADVVQAGEEFSKAALLAVQRGDVAEDRSQGHALAHDSTMRAVQDRFIHYAKRDLHDLRRVIRNSSNDAERALAAQVLGYAADKSAVIDDLVHGMSDPSGDVRNNAMRALMVIAEMAPSAGNPVPRIPPRPFIALLNSLVWSDRNKASSALMALTSNRDPRLLEALRRPEAITALAEMARWKSEGHAQAAFFVLGRIAGYPDDDALNLWRRGEREVVINEALRRR
jgi:hypothetical protein